MNASERHALVVADGLRFRVLGPVAVKSDGGWTPVSAPKQTAVATALLLSANQVVTVEHLCRMVWGEQPPPSVRGRLHVYISHLRSVFGKDVIDRSGGGYLINVAPGELDLQVFTEALATAQAELRAGFPEAAGTRLRSALELFTGPAVSGATKIMIERERERLEELRLTALEGLYEAEIAAERHTKVISELRQLVSNYPFRERLAAHLMRALYRCERRSDALQVYVNTHRQLVDGLGIEPGPALRELQAAILNDQRREARPDPSIALPTTASTGDPRVPSQPIRPAELPRDPHGFTGREPELALLTAWLADAADGLCVLSGIAGIGKTALAVRWAHRHREEFPDGQLYLNLHGYDPDHEPLSPTAALGRLLSSLGPGTRELPTHLEEQVALYRSLLADRRILVVLDNARDAAQVLPLIPPAGSAIVTSRRQLAGLVAHAGADVLALGTLDQHDARNLLESIVDPDRLGQEPGAATALIELCAGLPLALRIAAAHLATAPSTTVEAFITELTSEGDPLSALTLVGADDSPVAAAFAVSYHALPTGAQRLFRLLGLLPRPDFSLEVAAALTDSPPRDTRRDLSVLASAHVIERYRDNRYRIHDLLHRYAATRSAEDSERGDAWIRLVDYHLALTAVANARHAPTTLGLPLRRLPAGPTPRTAWQVELIPRAPDVEIDGAAAIAIAAAEHGPHPAAWLLAEELRTYYHRGGRRVEWLDIAPAILRFASEHEQPHVQALLHKSIGGTLLYAGQRDGGVQHMRQAVQHAQTAGWAECEAAVHADLGFALTWLGDITEATIHTQRAADLYPGLDCAAGENRVLLNLGGQYMILGKLHRAEEQFRKALAHSEHHGLRLARAVDLMYLGIVTTHLGRLAEAEQTLTQARVLCDQLGSVIALAHVNLELSRVWAARGEHERAFRDAAQALSLGEDGTSPLLEATIELALAEAEIDTGHEDAADEHLRLGLGVSRRADLRWPRVEGSRILARLHTQRGQHERAIAQARDARELAREHSYPLLEVTTLVTLTEAYVRAGDTGAAAVSGQAALALSRETGQAEQERRITALLSDTL